MKNKYQRMNKEEKNKLQKAYQTTKEGKAMLKRLTRIQIIGITGISFSLGLSVYAYFTDALTWDYINSGILFLISLFFIIKSYQLKIKVLNKEALKKK